VMAARVVLDSGQRPEGSADRASQPVGLKPFTQLPERNTIRGVIILYLSCEEQT